MAGRVAAQPSRHNDGIGDPVPEGSEGMTRTQLVERNCRLAELRRMAEKKAGVVK